MSSLKEIIKNFVRECKKSFTLVELSVVLLVLALLVSTLLVGRQIIDRAKITKVVTDFDYYFKSFKMFHDTYGSLPGNIDYKKCRKIAKFASIEYENSGQTICDYCEDKTEQENLPLYGQYAEQMLYINPINAGLSMVQMKAVGIISNQISGSWGVKNDNNEIYVTTTYTSTEEFAARSSFSTDSFFIYTSLGEDYDQEFRGIKGHYTTNSSNPLNIFDFEQLYQKNAILLYRNSSTPNSGDNGFDKSALGVLSARLSNQLDAKMDDGFPGSGYLLAIKSAKFTTAAEPNKICHNGTTERYEDNGGSYVNSTVDADGCNFLYVMKQ